jgi:hypothetical protein
MLKFAKWLIVMVLVLLIICAACHEDCRTVVCEKAIEGMAGGFLVGLVLAFSKIAQFRARHRVIPRLALCLIRHEICTGLVGGFLVGLAFAAIILAAE